MTGDKYDKYIKKINYGTFYKVKNACIFWIKKSKPQFEKMQLNACI